MVDRETIVSSSANRVKEKTVTVYLFPKGVLNSPKLPEKRVLTLALKGLAISVSRKGSTETSSLTKVVALLLLLLPNFLLGLNAEAIGDFLILVENFSVTLRNLLDLDTLAYLATL